MQHDKIFSNIEESNVLNLKNLISIKINCFSLIFAVLNKYDYVPIIFNFHLSYQNDSPFCKKPLNNFQKQPLGGIL